MKKYIYFILSFLFLFCTKKNVDTTFSEEQNIEARNFSVTFSRFSEDYYFWSEKQNLQNAAVAFVNIKNATGKNLSGTHQVRYGIYDDVILDDLIPATLQTGSIAFFDGAATFAVNLETLLTKANAKSKEGWFLLEFIFLDASNKEVARTKLGILVKQKREFKLKTLGFYIFEYDANKNNVEELEAARGEVIDPGSPIEPPAKLSEIEIEVDVSDPVFQVTPKALSPNFYVKFNDGLPKLYAFKADYTINKAYLTLSSSEVPTITSDLRLLVWHQTGDVSLAAQVRIGKPIRLIDQQLCRTTEEALLTQSPFSLATVVKSSYGKVVEMKLINKNLTSLPETLYCFRALEVLDLSQNKFTTFPTVTSKLRYIKRLNLNNNQLSSLPENLTFLYLEVLNLSANRLTTLPKLFNLTQLETLDLSKNQLSSLPENLSFPALVNLDLSSNQMTAFPQKLTAADLDQLYLANNKMVDISQSVWQFTRLTTLNLNDNPIKSLSTDIKKLTVLKYAYFKNNQFQMLPEALNTLRELKVLDVYSNTLVLTGQEVKNTITNPNPKQCGNLSLFRCSSGYILTQCRQVTCNNEIGICRYDFFCSETWENRTKQWLPNTQVIIKNTL